MKDLISIVVPIYRAEKYLPQCIDSLLAQTYRQIEIVLVDDGSPDRSGVICDEYAERDSRVKVIHEENSGISDARNTGLSHISGEYVMFVDSDDWISPDSCEKAFAAAKEYNADIVIWSYVREYGSKSLYRYIFTEEQSFEGDAYRHLILRMLGDTTTPETLDSLSPVWNKLYKVKNIADVVRFVDTKKIGNEDLLYNVQAFMLAQKAYYLHEAFYHYRKDNQSSFTSSYKRDMIAKRKVLFQTLSEEISRFSDPSYEMALRKRIALDVMGQCLNVVQSSEPIKNKHKLIEAIIHDEVFEPALKGLSTSGMRFHWRVYYGCAKSGCSTLVYMLTSAISILKRKK